MDLVVNMAVHIPTLMVAACIALAIYAISIYLLIVTVHTYLLVLNDICWADQLSFYELTF